MEEDELNDLTFGGGPSAADRFKMENQFVSATIDHGDSAQQAVGAMQYSFFGAMDDLGDALEGGLEDGIDAPPEEEGLIHASGLSLEDGGLGALEEDGGLGALEGDGGGLGMLDDDATEDLSLATMMGNLEMSMEDMIPKDMLRTDSEPIPAPRRSSLSGAAAAPGAHRASPVSSFQAASPIGASLDALGAQQLHPPPPPLPSMGLLDPVSIMQSTQQQLQQQQQQLHQQQQQQPMGPPRVMTNEELEARLLQGVQPQPKQQPPPPPSGMMVPMPPPGQVYPGVAVPQPQPQQQPQQGPGRPPLPPWMQQGGATPPGGAHAPPPPPPPGKRSPSPTARQPSPPAQRQPQHQGPGGFGSGFAIINKHQGPQLDYYNHQGHRRHRFRSRYMSEGDINHILRIQWTAVHTARPYHEDYYYQAFLAKHVNGANAAAFAPDALRDTAPQERAGQDSTMYVPLDGLGKIAMSNIRRPKPLMDLNPNSREEAAEDEGKAASNGVEGDSSGTTKPLEQEPMLAARIMVEDCMSLLLDVDDIERMFRKGVATGMRVEGAEALMKRRAVLMEGLASSMRLPETAVLPADHSADSADGVFLRLMMLPKGRRLLAQALRRLFSPFEPAGGAASGPQLRMLFAVMRHLRALFAYLPPEDPVAVIAQASSKEGAAEATRQRRANAMNTTAGIAEAGAEAMYRLASRMACVEALRAVMGGDLATGVKGSGTADALLPLSGPSGMQPGEFTSIWLGDFIAALLERASVLGLGRAAAGEGTPAAAGSEAAVWEEVVSKLIDMLMAHVAMVIQVFRAAKAQGIAEGMQYARAVVPVKVVRAAILHCSEEQRGELKTSLAELS